MILQEFMMRPDNNQYLYDYIINETSNLTLANEEQLETVNAYILDYSIINIIMAIFETPMKTGTSIMSKSPMTTLRTSHTHVLQLINLAFQKPVVHFILDSICPQTRD